MRHSVKSGWNLKLKWRDRDEPSDLADAYGYSDQAHLIREFKSFAHCTPRDFAASAPAYFELRQNEDWCDFMKEYFNLSYAG